MGPSGASWYIDGDYGGLCHESLGEKIQEPSSPVWGLNIQHTIRVIIQYLVQFTFWINIPLLLLIYLGPELEKCVLMRVAAFFCARWPQIWTPEEKYYQKMSSHTQIGQLGPKLGKKCLKMCLNARCRVFLRVPTSDLSSSAKVLPENVLKHPIYTAQTWETVLTFRWARIFKRNHSARARDERQRKVQLDLSFSTSWRIHYQS